MRRSVTKMRQEELNRHEERTSLEPMEPHRHDEKAMQIFVKTCHSKPMIWDVAPSETTERSLVDVTFLGRVLRESDVVKVCGSDGESAVHVMEELEAEAPQEQGTKQATVETRTRRVHWQELVK